MSKEQQTSFLDNHEVEGTPALWNEAPAPNSHIRAEDLRTIQAASAEDVWRRELADRVAAHRARRGQAAPAESSAAKAPLRGRERSQQMLESLERKMRDRREAEERELQLRREREEAERLEREELERFFAEFNRPVAVPQAVVEAHKTVAPKNVIQFPGPSGAAAAATAPALAPEPQFVPMEDPETPGQLTIFEELPPRVAIEPEPARMQARRAPALRLDEHYEPEPELDEEALRASLEVPLKVAPVEKRFVAALIDCVLVGASAMVFGSVFYSLDHQLPHSKAALGIVLATLWTMWAIYEVLFLTYCGVTPGMKAQRLAISDFDDQVPNPRQRFWRAISLLCTSLSLGLGFLWTLLEPDRLGWHDKMTRTFPRELA